MGPNIKSRLIDTIKGKIEQDLRSRFENQKKLRGKKIIIPANGS